MTIEAKVPARNSMGAGFTQKGNSQCDSALAVCAGVVARLAIATRAKLVDKSGLFWALPVLLLLLTMLSPAGAQAQTNFVYVNNQSASNSVSAYSVPAGGTPLTAVPGSPFATGGSGAT